MVRRSNRNKDLTPATVVDSSDEEFIAVSSEDPYVYFVFWLVIIIVLSHSCCLQ